MVIPQPDGDNLECISLTDNDTKCSILYTDVVIVYVNPGGDPGCRDRKVVRFTTTCTISAYTTKVVNSNTALCEMYSIRHDVIKFVNDLRQACGFL